jgi:hypothetical protein
MTGILGNRPPSLALEPPEQVSLDSGPPVEEFDHVNMPIDGSVPPIEVIGSDDVPPSIGEMPVKKPSLGRTHRIGRPVGLQRHFKRESVTAGEPSDVQDSDAVAVAANVHRGVTLTDGPVTK